jgi:hypothetical protein
MKIYHEDFTVCSRTAFENFLVLIKNGGKNTKKQTTKTFNVCKDKGKILVRGEWCSSFWIEQKAYSTRGATCFTGNGITVNVQVCHQGHDIKH